MDKSKLKIFIPLGIIFIFLVILMPRNSKFPYEYRKGREWKYETLFAQFDFPIYKTEEQIRLERSSTSAQLIPYYKYSEEIVARNIRAVENLKLGNLKSLVISEMKSIYNKGVLPDESKRLKNEDEIGVIYIQRDKRASKYPINEVYRLSAAQERLLSGISSKTNINVDSLLRVHDVYSLLVPNLVYDDQTTKLVRAESEQSVSPTSGFVTTGKIIVSKGELVTEEIEQILDSYKRETEANVGYIGTPFAMILGNILIAAAIVVLLYFVIVFSCRRIFKDSRYNYVLLVFLMTAAGALLASRVGDEFLYLVPFTLPAVMLQAFMKPKEIAPVYIISLLPLLIFAHDGPALFVMFLLAGIVGMSIFKYFQRGWMQFISALITFAMLALLYIGFSAADVVAGEMGQNIVRLLIGSLLTVAGYPLVYLFERVFNLVSNSRLQELCNTSNQLVRQLEQKAPGTFQHSLQVMNMVDAVARAIDENPDLLRAAALYHDIGKINNPMCFVENEFLLGQDEHKYHSELSPLQSAHDIIRHVEDGVMIARKHRLPQLIIDFIVSHHGTTTVRYFYDKFLKEGGDPERIQEFRYTGKRPKTKAQIILMLCDSIEAASRTLKGNNDPETYSRFVEGIVAGKMQEGQFDDAEISISELNIVKETLKQYIAQLNHERIAYPKSKLNKR